MSPSRADRRFFDSNTFTKCCFRFTIFGIYKDYSFQNKLRKFYFFQAEFSLSSLVEIKSGSPSGVRRCARHLLRYIETLIISSCKSHKSEISCKSRAFLSRKSWKIYFILPLLVIYSSFMDGVSKMEVRDVGRWKRYLNWNFSLKHSFWLEIVKTMTSETNISKYKCRSKRWVYFCIFYYLTLFCLSKRKQF